MKNYLKLETYFINLHALQGASAMLGWDNAVTMPKHSHEVRAEQLAALEEVIHQKKTSPELADLLYQAGDERDELDDWQRANLREMHRIWSHANAIETSLATSLSRASTACEAYWRTARANNDFKGFAPYLEKVIELVQLVAQAKAEAFGTNPYDAMLGQFDPGMTMADLDPIFDDLSGFLPDFTQAVMEHQKSKAAPLLLRGPFPTDHQQQLGEKLAKHLGFDFDHGRMDKSAHPFSTGSKGDVRITTRYNAQDFTESFLAVAHEVGHSLYEQNLHKDWHTQPVGQARGMSMHESQSLFVEKQLVKSLPFLTFFAPIIKSTLHGESDAWSAENIYASMCRVQPGMNRVNADEVTYPSHIILRYRLEKALLSGDLKVMDLPGAWNDGMEELLGIRPQNDGEGCMQDIHWTDGSIGYFPTYTIGAMIAAQLMAKIRHDIPTVSEQIQKGTLGELFEWLRTNIHRRGSYFSTQGLLKQATGKKLDPALYKAHLKQRYLEE